MTTIAGTGSSVGDNLQATVSSLSGPSGIAITPTTIYPIYFCDTLNSRIRKITTNGVITTIAGTGVATFSGDGGPAVNAAVNQPKGIILLNGGEIVFTDSGNHRIRKIYVNGTINTIVGTGEADFSGDGIALLVKLNSPSGITINSANTEIYFADSGNHVIRKITQLSTTPIVTRLVGTGVSGSNDITQAPISVKLNSPYGVFYSNDDNNLYFSDSGNDRVCKLSSNTVSEVVGSNDLSRPLGLAVVSGYMYICNSLGHTIRRKNINTSPYLITEFVGVNSQPGFSDGLANTNCISNPSNVVYSDGNIYIADTGNNRLRKSTVSDGQVSTISTIAGTSKQQFGSGIPALSASLSEPTSVFYLNEILTLADSKNHVVRSVDLSSKTITNLAGIIGQQAGSSGTGPDMNTPTFGMQQKLNSKIYFLENNCALKVIGSNSAFSLVAGSCSVAPISSPTSYNLAYFKSNHFVMKDQDGTIYLTDFYHNMILKISGVDVTIIAGSGTAGYSGDGQSALNAKLDSPDGIALYSGALYFTENNNHVIRKIDLQSGIISTVAGNTIAGFSGDGGSALSASLKTPGAIEVTSTGDLIFIDKGNQRIRKVTNGKISTLAGIGTKGYSPDFISALNTQFSDPNGLSLGNPGEIYIADTGNNAIRLMSFQSCGSDKKFFNSSTFECSCYNANYYGADCEQFDCYGINNMEANVCSGGGLCQSPNYCNCSAQHYGSNCEQFDCYGIKYSNSSVCSSHGSCVKPNNCSCLEGYFGNTCTNFTCFGLAVSNSSVCSGRGQCTSYNNCSCPLGYYGNECELYNCNGVVKTSASVCSGHGTCNSYNNCTCSTGYFGNYCNDFTCAGQSFGVSVCQNNGTCDGPGVCQCPIEWGGDKCEFVKCFNLLSSNTSICSGNGQCTSYNNCTCNQGWEEKDCSLTSCFGIQSNSSSVCTGRGKCEGPNQCKCNSGYGSEECQHILCFGFYSNDSNVCSSRGGCIDSNICLCNEGFTGSKCQYHQVLLDAPNAVIYSPFSSILNISKQEGDVVSCDQILNLDEQGKFGEKDFIQCLWTSSYFKIILGYDHSIVHGSIILLNSDSRYNISLMVNSTDSLNTMRGRTFVSSINDLLTTLPPSQDLIVRSNTDDYYHSFRRVQRVWTCDNCPQTISSHLSQYNNRSIINIPISLLNTIPLDASYLRVLNLKLDSFNVLNYATSSRDITRVQPNVKSLPPSFTWLGDNVKDAPFSCVGHNCIVESSLNSLNSTISFTFSGFFSLLNAEFSQKQMFRLVNVYNNELIDSEYNSNAQVVGLHLKTYESLSLPYYFNYKTFDRLDHVLTLVNRTHSIRNGVITITFENDDPFITTFTIKDYFTYSYSCYRVDASTKLPISPNLCTSQNTQQSLTIDPDSMSLSEGVYSINLIVYYTNSFVTIPYNYIGFITLTNESIQAPKITTSYRPPIHVSHRPLILKTLISSSSSVSTSWKLVEGRLNVAVGENIEEFLRMRETIRNVGGNSVTSELSIGNEYLVEGEFYSFELTTMNEFGQSNISFSTRIDNTPRFSCSYYNLRNELVNYAFESYTVISCLNLPSEPVSNYVMEVHSQQGERISILSNTLKKNLVTRLPLSRDGSDLNLIVKLVNRYGSIGTFTRTISMNAPNSITNSISSKINYLNDQFYTLKRVEPLKIETMNSINSLVSIILFNETSFENFTTRLFSETSNTQIQNLNSNLNEMLTLMINIQSLTSKVDEKIIQMVLPPICGIFSILDLTLQNENSINSMTDNLVKWLDWIYSGMEKSKQYYSSALRLTLLDEKHYSEIAKLQSILIRRYSSKLEKQALIVGYQVKYLLLSGLLTSNNTLENYSLESMDLATQLNGKEVSKTIENTIQVLATFPSDFTSQLSIIPNNVKLFYSTSLIKNDATQNNILGDRPLFELSIYTQESGAQVPISGLTRPISIKFNNLFTSDKPDTNISCSYYDSIQQTWSNFGITTQSMTIIKRENGKLYFNLECFTTHLSLFTVQELAYYYTPNVSTSRPSPLSSQRASNDQTLGIVLGITIPVVLIAVIVLVIVILVFSICVWKLKSQKQKAYEIATIQNIELGQSTDFPSDASMFLTPLTSISSGGGDNQSFNPLSRYLDLVKIGQGAFGSVFKAFDSKTNTMKAIKVIRYTSMEELNNFMKEGTQLMNINHSNILKVNDFFISKDQLLCIDMDFYELGDLVQLTKDDSTCSEKVLLQIIFQMCSALDYIHSSMKLIHRDIKPSNIFVRSLDHDNIQVVIADFGLAKSNQGSTNNSYAGTPLFMSPELGYGGKYFYNTDIYSLGVTIYQIITKDTFTSISQLYVTKEQREVSQLLKKKMEDSGQFSPNIINLTLSMLEKDSAIRPQAQDLLNNAIFDQLRRRR